MNWEEHHCHRLRMPQIGADEVNAPPHCCPLPAARRCRCRCCCRYPCCCPCPCLPLLCTSESLQLILAQSPPSIWPQVEYGAVLVGVASAVYALYHPQGELFFHQVHT